MEDHRDVQYVKFWAFWLWNYCSRNEEYNRGYNIYKNRISREISQWIQRNDVFTSDDIEQMIEHGCLPIDRWGVNEILLNIFREKAGYIEDDVSMLNKIFGGESEIFFENFDSNPLNPNNKINSTDLLRELSSDLEEYHIQCFPGAIYAGSGNVAIVKARTKSKGTNKLVEYLNWFPGPLYRTFSEGWQMDINKTRTITIEISHQRTLDSILAEVTYLYNYSKSIEYCDTNEGKKLNENYLADRAKLVRQYIDLTGASFSINHLPRAIGLWLWDNIQDKYGRHYNLPRRAKADSIRELRETFDIVKKKYGASEMAIFRHMYARTCICVDKRAVLSFKGGKVETNTEE